MTDGSDYSDLLPHLHDAFQRYYNTGQGVVSVEMMKSDRGSGEMSMETVHIALMNSMSYAFYKSVIPLLHDPTMQAHLLAVIEETLARAKEDEDSDPEPG